MKIFLKKFVLTVVFIFGFVLAYAQVTVSGIGNAIGSGNVSGISRYFDNAISMTISGSQSTYSRSQAEMILKDFFSKHVARGFNLEQNGGSNGNSYAIGTLSTATGSYRTYFTVRQKDGKYLIQELRIEK